MSSSFNDSTRFFSDFLSLPNQDFLGKYIMSNYDFINCGPIVQRLARNRD